VVNELADKTPVWDEVSSMYDPLNERIKVQNYRLDSKLYQ